MAIKYITLTKEQRAKLINQPGCTIEDCPKEAPFKKCGCENCAAHNGYWRKNEKNEHEFTVKQLKIIEVSWSTEVGYLRNDGCILVRELRSDLCLFAFCGYLKLKRGKRNGL